MLFLHYMSFSIYESLFPSSNKTYCCKYDEEKNELVFGRLGSEDAMTLNDIKEKLSGKEDVKITASSNGCNNAMTFLEDIKEDKNLVNKINKIIFNVPYDKMNTATALGFVARVIPKAIKGIWQGLYREDEIEVSNHTKEEISNSKEGVPVMKEKRNTIVNRLWNYIARPAIIGLVTGIGLPIGLPIVSTVMLGKSIKNRINGVDNSKYTKDMHLFERFSNFLKENTDINGQWMYSVNDDVITNCDVCEYVDGVAAIKPEYMGMMPENLKILVSDNNEHSYDKNNNIYDCERDVDGKIVENGYEYRGSEWNERDKDKEKAEISREINGKVKDRNYEITRADFMRYRASGILNPDPESYKNTYGKNYELYKYNVKIEKDCLSGTRYYITERVKDPSFIDTMYKKKKNKNKMTKDV
jgi:hypothetical protein